MGSGQPSTGRVSSSSKREDRLHSRHDWQKAVQVAWISAPDEIPKSPSLVRAHNISAGGLALRSRCMVHPGQLGVVLLGKGSEDALTRGIEVRHCEYDDKLKLHIVGCGWVEIPCFVRATVVEDARHGMKLLIAGARDKFDDDSAGTRRCSGETESA